MFYPDKPISVQITVNHIDTSDKSYVHDAAVSWVENVYYHQFTACMMAAGFNERKSTANVTIDWVAYQGAPVGGVSGDVRISQWWTGTTCETINFPPVSDILLLSFLVYHFLVLQGSYDPVSFTVSYRLYLSLKTTTITVQIFQCCVCPLKLSTEFKHTPTEIMCTRSTSTDLYKFNRRLIVIS